MVKLWIYNYDFEFKLARMRKTRAGSGRFFPWHALNRCANSLLPLALPGDAILAYEKPDFAILNILKAKGLRIPDYEVLSLTKAESNSILSDFRYASNYSKLTQKYNLSPWGWAQACHISHTIDPPYEIPYNLIVDLNSKETSFILREAHLPPNSRIPSMILNRECLAQKDLAVWLREFYLINNQFYIKHYWGTSGRLSTIYSGVNLSVKKTNFWKNEIKKYGGILIEKKIDFDKEWSLQVEFAAHGQYKIQGLTELLSGSDGCYLGTIIRRKKSEKLNAAVDFLRPVIQYLAKKGYTGPAGFDLAEISPNCFMLFEINARYTMGRIALEWFKAGSDHFSTGLFINRFLRKPLPELNRLLFEIIPNIENRLNTRIFPVNYIQKSNKGNSLLTVFVNADSSVICQKAVESLISG